MNKCLVTKLNGSVSDNSLLKIGEMRIKVDKIDSPTNKSQAIKINVVKPITLTIIGDGYFTDSTLSENKGKTVSLSIGEKVLYVSNGDYEISISNKYALYVFFDGDIEYTNVSSNKLIDVDCLKYSDNLVDFRTKKCIGNIASLNNKNFVNIYVRGGDVYGDVSNLKLQNANLIVLTAGNLNGTSSFAVNATKVKLIDTFGSDIKVLLPDLTNSVSLDSIIGNVTGDVSNVKNIGTLKHIVSYGGVLTGDIAVLSPNLIRIENNKGIFTWSNRASSSKIFSIIGSPKIDNIDKMLQDMANCVAQTGTGFTTISAKGTRTSASDAAVQTLQQKGYTVSVIPIPAGV